MIEQPPCRIAGDDLILQVRVSTRSSREEIEVRDGLIRLRIRSAPVAGKANSAIRRLLSRSFRVPISSVTIERGTTASSKSIRIATPGTLPAWLIELLHS